MSLAVAAGAVYRLPPFVLGPQIFMAAELQDAVDWGLKLLQVPDHWLTAGKGVTVGVADTGRPVHSDLDGVIKASRNFSTSFTDEDQVGHATHVCGILAARKNGRGIVGVAPECEIVTAKVLGDDMSGDSISIAHGVQWLIEQGCQILNLSLGGAYDDTLAKILKEAVDAGVFVICAAGNEGNLEGRDTVGYPARLPYTVAITSYNEKGEISPFASRGPEIDLALPGENILSCWLENNFRRISGTSMATPFASGLVALLLSASKDWKEQEKVHNNAELLQLIRQVTVDKGDVGPDRDWGWGVLDLSKFVQKPATPLTAQAVLPGSPELPANLLAQTIQYNGKNGLFITTR